MPSNSFAIVKTPCCEFLTSQHSGRFLSFCVSVFVILRGTQHKCYKSVDKYEYYTRICLKCGKKEDINSYITPANLRRLNNAKFLSISGVYGGVENKSVHGNIVPLIVDFLRILWYNENIKLGGQSIWKL
ncbi:MAG: hypothetical protein LBC82_07935 [Oscillospiraceae bacterium]|jgi:hypothetical protein|nr:hypothetical protein [Oscillospiraceae bacterium]